MFFQNSKYYNCIKYTRSSNNNHSHVLSRNIVKTAYFNIVSMLCMQPRHKTETGVNLFCVWLNIKMKINSSNMGHEEKYVMT